MTSTHSRAVGLAILCGGALVLDTVLIAALDRSFGLPDSILFVGGFLGSFGAVALASWGLTAGTARRPLRAVAIAVVALAALSALSSGADALSHALYDGTNRGLRDECGVFTLGVAMLVLAAVLHARTAGAGGRRATPDGAIHAA